tara:strand:+ start:4589 stop:5632 length:1044 start_codon:yes stop_codon:yes gene_type:complete
MEGLGLILPSETPSISEASFIESQTWKHDSRRINKRRGSFRDRLYESLPFSDEERPNGETWSKVDFGKISLVVKTKPSVKRPSFKEAVDAFEAYLGFILEQYEREEVSRGRVITVETEPYITIPTLINKIEYEKEKIKTGTEGVSQSVDVHDPEKTLEDEVDFLPFDPDRDYSPLTEYNAWFYAISEIFLKEGNRRDGEFKKLLKAQSIEQVGGKVARIAHARYPYSMSGWLNQLEYRETPEYGKIFAALHREPPEKLTRRSSIGDLQLGNILAFRDPILEELLAKGVVTEASIEEYRTDYHPIRRAERGFLRLRGVIQRFERYNKELRSSTIEQNPELTSLRPRPS